MKVESDLLTAGEIGSRDRRVIRVEGPPAHAGITAALRRAFEAAAPPVFAYVAILLGGNGNVASAKPSDVVGLDRALAVMLATLALAGLVLLFGATRTYARDAATAIASDEASRSRGFTKKASIANRRTKSSPTASPPRRNPR